MSHQELTLLLLLRSAPRKSYDYRTGQILWTLAAEDICYLRHLAVELIDHWGATTPKHAYTHATRLLGVPLQPADTTQTHSTAAAGTVSA